VDSPLIPSPTIAMGLGKKLNMSEELAIDLPFSV
jgi:hypothetical protein